MMSFQPDIAVVAGFAVLPEVIFSAPRLGMLNVHYSLLGVTVHSVSRKVDCGPIVSQRRFELPVARERFESVLQEAIQGVPAHPESEDDLVPAIRAVADFVEEEVEATHYVPQALLAVRDALDIKAGLAAPVAIEHRPLDFYTQERAVTLLGAALGRAFAARTNSVATGADRSVAAAPPRTTFQRWKERLFG